MEDETVFVKTVRDYKTGEKVSVVLPDNAPDWYQGWRCRTVGIGKLDVWDLARSTFRKQREYLGKRGALSEAQKRVDEARRHLQRMEKDLANLGEQTDAAYWMWYAYNDEMVRRYGKDPMDD